MGHAMPMIMPGGRRASDSDSERDRDKDRDKDRKATRKKRLRQTETVTETGTVIHRWRESAVQYGARGQKSWIYT